MGVTRIIGVLLGVLLVTISIQAESTAEMCSRTKIDATAQEVKEKLETLYERADNETDAAMTENAAFFEATAQSIEEAKKSCPDQNTTALATVLRRMKQCAQSFSKRGKEGCSSKCQALDDQTQFNYVIRQKVVDGQSFEQAVKCARAFSSAEQKARLYRALSLDASKFPTDKGDALFNTVKEALTAGKVTFNDKDKNVMKSALKTIVAKTYLNAPENATCPGLIKKLAQYDRELAFEALDELAQEFNKSNKHDEALALLDRVSCLNLQFRGFLALHDSLEHAQDSDKIKTSLVFPVYIGVSTPYYKELDSDLRTKVDKLYSELPENARNVLKSSETCLSHDFFVPPSNDSESTADSPVIFLRAENRDYSNIHEHKFIPKTDGKVLQIKHTGSLGGYVHLPSDTDMTDLDSLFVLGEKTLGDWEAADGGYFCEINEGNEPRPVCLTASEDANKINQSELLEEFKTKYIKEYNDKREEKCQKQ